MKAQHIESIFFEYLKTDKTQYAILLNGKWGCGKTFYWEHSLDPIAKQCEFKTLYISLNGISKVDALEHLLFIKLIPYIGNQKNVAFKNTIRFMTNIINVTTTVFLKLRLSELFKDISVDSFDYSKYVICFDDFERCKMPLKEVLGYINNFVEHKNSKIIILADESKTGSNLKGYNNLKEKVVGRIINFETNISIILPQLFKKYETKDVDFFNFLISQKDAIGNIFEEYQEPNLRIIYFYLDILEKIFPQYKNVDDKYVQEIILFAALISIEFKKGNLTSDDYKDYRGIDTINEYFISSKIEQGLVENGKAKSQNVKEYHETFYDIYLRKNIKNYFFYPSIYSYILSGFYNSSELEIELQNRIPEIINQEVQDYRTLLNYKFRELSDADFKRLSESVLQFAKAGKYWIYDYIQIGKFFYFFSDNKLISESKEEIEKIIIEGLYIAKRRKLVNDEILENLVHFDEDNPETKKIKNLVKEIHSEIKKETHIAEGKELIDCLSNKDEYALATIFEKHKFSKDLFQYIDEKLLLNTILNISNKQLFNFEQQIQYRYEVGNIGEFLFEDSICLTKLRDNISEYLEKEIDILHLRKFLLSTLVKTLQTSIEHLKNTRKK